MARLYHQPFTRQTVQEDSATRSLVSPPALVGIVIGEQIGLRQAKNPKNPKNPKKPKKPKKPQELPRTP